jgi:CTP:molybdopterin cytidylyltransferase MocA
MSESIGLLVFANGAAPAHPLLRQMHAVRQACARDLLERALETASFDPIVVVTGDRAWAASLDRLPVTVDLDGDGEPFHFGRRLAGVIDRFKLARLLYMGAASAPLVTAADLARIAAAARQHKRAVIANNINSTDWAAITPASAVRGWIDRLPTDNALGWVLSHEAGLEPIGWPPSPATRLDLDVPIDAQIAARHPRCGSRAREAVSQMPWDDRRLRAACEVLKTPATRVILAGRVPSWAIAQMEKTVQCWTRVYSEERGMRAAGRLEAGQVRSLLNDHLGAVGLSRFMADLCSMADAMLWDTRVLWAAGGVWPSEEDRYAADLGWVDAIGDPFIREFTQAVLDAPIPIVTGGHALVSGGLWALLDSMNNDQ